jgi:hypothetical protein
VSRRKGITCSRSIGTSTKIPHNPYTTLGTAARRSTRKPIGCRSHVGENSERKIATPIASGVAMMSATAEETSVPKIAGAAPNFPAPTSHSLDVTIDSPSLAKAGHAATKMAIAMAATSAGTTSAHAVVAIS